jgi:hypothetical protein
MESLNLGPELENAGVGAIALGLAMLERAERASHIDPPASSYAIMQRACPYCGENPGPGKDVDGELEPRPGIRERPRPIAARGCQTLARSDALAASDTLVPKRTVRGPAARQRPRPDARICGGEVSLNLPLASDHSITSSASASNFSGIWRPSALAVLRLMASSNLTGFCTGSSCTLAPLRMRSTYDAARRYMS